MTSKYRLRGWNPDRMLAEIAARQNLSVEEYERQTEERARQFEASGPHLSLQAAQSHDLNDEQQAHVERCESCRQLLEDIQPSADEFRELDSALRAQLEDAPVAHTEAEFAGSVTKLVPARAKPSFDVSQRAWAIAAGVVIAVVGAWAVLHDGTHTENLLNADPLLVRSEVRQLWGVGQRPASDGVQLCQTAARFQRAGDPALARQFALQAVTLSDIPDSQFSKAALALETPSAKLPLVRDYASRQIARLSLAAPAPNTLAELSRLSFRAGEPSTGFAYLARYLDASKSSSEIAACFGKEFSFTANANTRSATPH